MRSLAEALPVLPVRQPSASFEFLVKFAQQAPDTQLSLRLSLTVQALLTSVSLSMPLNMPLSRLSVLPCRLAAFDCRQIPPPTPVSFFARYIIGKF